MLSGAADIPFQGFTNGFLSQKDTKAVHFRQPLLILTLAQYTTCHHWHFPQAQINDATLE